MREQRPRECGSHPREQLLRHPPKPLPIPPIHRVPRHTLISPSPRVHHLRLRAVHEVPPANPLHQRRYRRQNRRRRPSATDFIAPRVFRAVADHGTFTAAVAALGYAQSAVSRQIAAIERAAGSPLLERRRDGVRLTPAGRIVMRHAAVVLDEIDTTARELAGGTATATVRLGWVPAAGATVVPDALTRLRLSDPGHPRRPHTRARPCPARGCTGLGGAVVGATLRRT